MGSCQAEPAETSARRSALRAEQDYVTHVYARLDVVRERAEDALRETHGRDAGSTPNAVVEREVTANEHARRLAQLTGVERGLCFGRIDHRGDGATVDAAGEDGEDGHTLYIGRIGLRDEDHESLLVDWRAPAARPFYSATPGSPGPLVRRRHLHTRGRTVVDIDDEVFDLDGLGDAARGTLVGEAALLASLRRGRTGRMSDVVATIQDEQDKVIRSGLQGVLVVQGGPGTGKTVAALHRAAYLLYTHRDTLERRGVLVVGPNATFLRYIDQVLPSLGETDVVMVTVGELYPGVRATATEAAAVEVVKGDTRMADLVGAAVADRQRVPRDGIEVEVDGMTLRAGHAEAVRARDRARALRRPHNVARRRYVTDVLTALVHDQADQLGRPVDADDVGHARAALWAEDAVREAIDALWPRLTPERLLTELFADAGTLRRLASEAGVTDEEQESLPRPPASPWTTADVPLLDEAAELLGYDDAVGTDGTADTADTAARARERAAAEERRAEEHYAEGVLELTGQVDEDVTDRVEREEGMIDAAALAERHRDTGPAVTTAERAGADRGWAYGHVIVDEAQELSPMAWRTVMRRVPTRSVTAVGDVAQTGSAAGARSWAEMLDPYVRGRWREERLLVNYRTPVEVMEVAADVLQAVAPDQEPPESVRDGEAPPRAVRMTGQELPAGLPSLVETELAAIGEGRLAVITSGARHAAVRSALPGAASGATPEALDSPTIVLTTTQAKGLEFDAVVVVDPAGIAGESPKGGHDLYVAITRATRRLTVVYSEELPATLERLNRSRSGLAWAP